MKTSGLLFVIFFVLACNPKTDQPKISSPLHFTLSGNGTQTLVFVHGWCINGSYWNNQAEAFKNKYKVLTLDLAGHGKSKVARKEWTMSNYANDIADLITQLKLDSVILIGHSMSGNINLLVYDKIPEKVIGFIGVDNLQELGKEMNDTSRAQWESFFKMLETDYRTAAGQFANFLFSPTTDSLVRDRVMHDILQADTLMAVATLRSLFEESLTEKVLSKKLKVPLLLINSDVHPVDENLLAQNAGSGYKIFYVQGTGHYPMIEAPQEFNARLQESLNFIRSSFRK